LQQQLWHASPATAVDLSATAECHMRWAVSIGRSAFKGAATAAANTIQNGSGYALVNRKSK